MQGYVWRFASTILGIVTAFNERSMCLVGSHGLTHVVGALSEIAANTSTVHMADGSRDSKREAKQWSKMSTRLMDLHDWCAEFGPGSDCR